MTKDEPFRFAFLNNEAHPVGRLMLERLCCEGYRPQMIVEERSSFAVRKTAAYVKCLTNEEMPLSCQVIAHRFAIPLCVVENVNGPDCQDTLRRSQITIAILGNTRIIKPEMLALLGNGCFNVHPGLLPRVRGAFPQCWSILQDEPIGCTCHFVDVGVDTGPIINRQTVPVFREDNLERIVARTMFASADLMLATLQNLHQLTANPEPQIGSEGTTFPWPSPDKIESARIKLARGEYRYFAPNPS